MPFGSSGTNVGAIEYDARITTDKLKEDSRKAEVIAKNTGDSISSHTERGTGRAGQALKKFAKVAAVAFAAAGASVVALGVSSAKAFIESENAIAQTEAVLKSTKKAAGVTSKAVTDLANSLQRQTRYSDESIRTAENMILTFTNIGKKTFPGATEAVLDMATAMGSDLQSTAIQVGKALQDPVRGATALQRVGVRLTESQKELIAKHVEAGDAAKAQAIILKELQTEFGGSAKAAGETFAGRLDILKNQLGEVQEGIGEIIVRGLTPLVAGFLKAFDAAGGVEGIMAKLKSAFGSVLPQLKQWASNIAEVARQVGEYLGPKMKALGNTLREEVVPLLMRLWKEVLQPLIPVIGTALVVAFGLATDALNVFFNLATPVIEWMLNNKGVVIGFAAAFGTLKAAMMLNKAFNALTVGFQVFRLVTIPSTIASLGALRAAFIAAFPGAIAIAAIVATTLAVDKLLNKFDLVRKMTAEIDSRTQGSNESIRRSLIQARKQYEAGDISKKRYNAILNSAYGGLAEGTNYWRGGTTVVGERGPEIVNLPRGSQVIPNHEISDYMGKQSSPSNINVTLNLSGVMSRSKADERDIAKSLLRTVNDELKAKGVAVLGGGAI